MRNPTIWISAGELSADRYGAALVKVLRSKRPELRFIGMGCEGLKEAGVEIIADLSKASTIGFIEPLLHLPRYFYTLFKLKKELKKQKPHLVVVIDFQGFHTVFLKAVKTLGIPVVYYIAPQEWQWGSEEGGKTVVHLTTKILSIFQEESDFYTRLGADAPFIGHPIWDLVKPNQNKTEFCQEIGIKPEAEVVAVFPGSRMQELNYVAPRLLAAAKQIQKKRHDSQIVVSVAAPHLKNKIERLCKSAKLNATLHFGNAHNLIAKAGVSLTCSGTVTLEHAVLQTPAVVAYAFSPISFWLAQKLIWKKFVERIRFIALPNLLLKKQVFPEFLQAQATSENLASAGLKILENPSKRSQIQTELRELSKIIGSPGATERAAKEILTFF